MKHITYLNNYGEGMEQIYANKILRFYANKRSLELKIQREDTSELPLIGLPNYNLFYKPELTVSEKLSEYLGEVTLGGIIKFISLSVMVWVLVVGILSI